MLDKSCNGADFSSEGIGLVRALQGKADVDRSTSYFMALLHGLGLCLRITLASAWACGKLGSGIQVRPQKTGLWDASFYRLQAVPWGHASPSNKNCVGVSPALKLRYLRIWCLSLSQCPP